MVLSNLKTSACFRYKIAGSANIGCLIIINSGICLKAALYLAVILKMMYFFN